MNETNYADKWKDTQTTCTDVSHHRRKHVHVFTWGGGVSTIAAEHSSPKHISTEQTVYQVPQKETQLGRNRYGKPGW